MQKVEITLDDIKQAEISLLDNGQSFDTIERVPFIQNLETCDLLAVPGSGKTTALLAKLSCLEKKLPFNNNSGILVLAHTNIAVDEIKIKLKEIAPKLLVYPNFIGTIQGFVNEFLAIPYFNSRNKMKPYRIDADLYLSEVEKKLNPYKKGDMFYVIKKHPDIFYKSRFKLDEHGKHYLVKEFESDKLDFTKPQKWEEQRKQDVLCKVNDIKISLLREGYLHYDDCYFLAETYLNKYPLMTKVIQERFRYVFVDEMQDLDKHQIDIIDKVFYTEDSKSIIQRIGDKNQAIYSSGNKILIECEWKTRNEMVITGSNRLTNEVAQIVDGLVLDRSPSNYKVKGLKKLKAAIPPHLFLFNWDNKEKLINKFKEIITQYQNLKSIPKKTKYPFKIIVWSGEWKDEEKDDAISKKRIRLENICNYSREENSNKENFDSLSKYLHLYPNEDNTLRPIRESILNALVHILRLEGVKYLAIIQEQERKRYFSKSTLIKYIQNDEKGIYEKFKQDIYDWCCDIAKGKYNEAFDKINAFVKNELKDWFNIKLCKESKLFIGNYVKTERVIKVIDVKEDLDIHIGTVHSAKGQTHCATLYIETYYHGYEVEKIKSINPFIKIPHTCSAKRDKEALKMLYVGFSRPTHLLCFAVHEESVKNDLDKFEAAGWKIERV
jgi:ATP-dependent DNA helicase UvrD/PcrA